MPAADDEEIVTYPFGAPEPPPRVSRHRGRRWIKTVAIVMAVLLAGTAAVLLLNSLNERRALKVGDCAIGRNYDDFGKADCADERATYIVLAIMPDEACPAVAGAVHEQPVDGQWVCFGRKGVDPATAANGAQVGECLTWPDSNAEPIRTPCDSPTAKVRVSQRITNIGAPQAKDTCGEDQVYGWEWSNVHNDQTDDNPTYYNLALCLSAL